MPAQMAYIGVDRLHEGVQRGHPAEGGQMSRAEYKGEAHEGEQVLFVHGTTGGVQDLQRTQVS